MQAFFRGLSITEYLNYIGTMVYTATAPSHPVQGGSRRLASFISGREFLFWALPGILLFLASCSPTPDIRVSTIKADYKENPVGVGQRPGFSWQLASDIRNQRQTAYRMLVADDPALLNRDNGNMWDTEKVESDQSLHISYEGRSLEPGRIFYWKVKVWDKNGVESPWSQQGQFVTALFNKDDWSGAEWIRHEDIHDSLVLFPGVHPWGKNVKHLALRKPVIPLFRKEFNAQKEIKEAYLFISGLGHYKAYVNGKMVSDDFLSPGWTQYRDQVLYNVYDISPQVQKGENAVGVIVGSGFYNIHNERYRKLLITYGMPTMIAKLKLVYVDGSEESVVSGADWKTSPSPYAFSTIYGGETYDANLEQEGWDLPGFNDQDWQTSLTGKDPGGVMQPESGYPVKAMETFSPARIMRLDSANYLYDFGQNASGIVRLKVRGKKGGKVRLIPGELVNDKQYVTQGATGKPYYWEYVLKGDGEEIWQPQFTYYGFRYVQVEGGKPVDENDNGDKPEILDLTFLHTFNSAPDVGAFSNSNELFNQVDNLIRYAIQSNFQSVLTDCPHREKLGWLEQTHLMGASVHYNFNLYHLYRKLVNDMMDSQWDNGLIPSIAPEYVYFGGDFTDSPEWGSAGIILPWLIYKWYGDVSVMEHAWPMMENYLAYLESRSENHIVSHGLGDWYDIGPKHPGYAQLTPIALTATATYYYDAKLMGEMAALLGKADDAKRLQALAEEVRTAFNDKFYDAEKKIYATGSQTAMAMPLCLGLVNESDRDAVVGNLVDSIRSNNKALTAGDVGFHYLVQALTEGGQSQLFYEMNNRDDVPGYGYQLKKGATALTESWQALPNVSNNHLMLGHIMEWFYSGLGGIRQEETSFGYKNIVIAPDMVGDLEHASAGYESPYGTIKCEWRKNGENIEMDVEIPVNASATIYIPADNQDQVTESGKPLTDLPELQVAGQENGRIKVKAGSGRYSFKSNL